MIQIKVDIEIKRPVEEVFAYLSNVENNPLWQSGMEEARITSEGPLGVGSTYSQLATFMGKRIESRFEIVAYEPNRMIKGTTIESSFPITFMRSVEPIAGGTKVRAVIDGDASGFFKLFEPLLAWFTRRSINADYKNLKRILESRA